VGSHQVARLDLLAQDQVDPHQFNKRLSEAAMDREAEPVRCLTASLIHYARREPRVTMPGILPPGHPTGGRSATQAPMIEISDPVPADAAGESPWT
jgi:hypothetical protein